MSELAPGEVIGGHYTIVRPIGRGGTAVVYEARQRRSGGEVAVKVLACAEPERFSRELLFASRVRHPNIVQLLDYGVLEGTGHPYLVMQRLRGRSLYEVLLREGALPEERVARLFLGPLEALAQAHALGVVHQDIKPSNLFVRANPDGSEDLVVLDFGIAGRAQQEREGPQLMATPRYAPPELVLRGEVSAAVDVYQMGLVIAEALSGRPVVDSPSTSDCLAIHASGGIELPSEVLRSRFCGVIRCALSPDPDDRPRDAGALLAALKEAAAAPCDVPPSHFEDDSGTTQPSLEPRAAWRPAPRRRRGPPIVPILVIVGAVALLAFLVGVLVGAVLPLP